MCVTVSLHSSTSFFRTRSTLETENADRLFTVRYDMVHGTSIIFISRFQRPVRRDRGKEVFVFSDDREEMDNSCEDINNVVVHVYLSCTQRGGETRGPGALLLRTFLCVSFTRGTTSGRNLANKGGE